MKYALSFLVIHFFFTISMGLLANEKINFKSKRFYISFLITYVLLILNCEFSLPFLRIIINPFIYMLLSKLLFKMNIKESVLLGILIIIVGIISELIYNIIAFSVLSHAIVVMQEPLLVLINNFFIGIILIVICSIKQMRKTYDFLWQITNKINEKQIVFISLLIVILCNCLWWFSYFIFNNVVKYTNLIITSSILNLASVLLVLFYLKVNNKYLSMSEKYNYSLQSIREFELMIENYKINTHENKNQFRTIRNMSKNKKINSYIDALLDESITDDEKVLMDIQRIPAGGLRGIIYSKLLLMHQKNISTELVIDKKITSAKVNNIDDYTLTAICRILGVLLDNAIEGVNNLENKYIMVELYEEDKELVISITNNYEGYVDVGSINQPGISSKGKEHGYGLTLVQRLVKKNKKIQHRSEFFEDNFMQKIKIKV